MILADSAVELSSHDSIAIVAFPEYPKYPRLSREILARLSDQLRAVQSAECFEGLVIASNSSSFATGAKLEEVAELSGLQALEFARLGQGVLREIALSSIPVVAAIRGFCLGGGLDLALACNGRVAAYNSSFGCPGATLGLLTGWGGTERLPRLVGTSAAMQMLVTGERVPATQALTLGLVDELVPSMDLVGAAARRARVIAVEASRSHAPLRIWT
ncbi:MAG TPA: enoyl-CoA hydratase/isomerase family protein [Terriglobia bacterium]|nr:enoyl-CoA hydratase/isomerase family protein [Terriglobia bacterium]